MKAIVDIVRMATMSLVLSPLPMILVATRALGDGGFLPPADYSGKDLTEPGQRAVLVHDANCETLFLSVDYEGDAGRFAWVIPCPAKPRVRTAPKEVFEEVAKYYHHLRLLAWEEKRKRRREVGEFGGGPPTDDGVVVHSVRLLGPYETAVLSAKKGNALVDWLNKKGYRIPDHAASIVDEYVTENSFFVAVKIHTQPSQLQTLPPLRIDFPTETPVYPLRISAVGSGVTDIRVYYFRHIGKQRDGSEGSRRLFYPASVDFEKLCPTVRRELPNVDWQTMELGRLADSLVPQAMRRLDDRLYCEPEVGHAGFYPYVTIAKTIGIAEALLSHRAKEAAWAEENLHYYYYRKPRPGDLPPEHLTELRNLGKRLGTPLRDKLLAYIDTYVQATKRRQEHFGRSEWVRYLGVVGGGSNLEGATTLLVRTCAPEDTRVLSTLEELAMAPGHNSYFVDALHDLGSPESRRTLARIAIQTHCQGTADRFVRSLRANGISRQEMYVASKELVSLLSEDFARGDAETWAIRLLREYTQQDFGRDWQRWANWLSENTHKFGR